MADTKTAQVDPDRLARFTDDADLIASRQVIRAPATGKTPAPVPAGRPPAR